MGTLTSMEEDEEYQKINAQLLALQQRNREDQIGARSIPVRPVDNHPRPHSDLPDVEHLGPIPPIDTYDDVSRAVLNARDRQVIGKNGTRYGRDVADVYPDMQAINERWKQRKHDVARDYVNETRGNDARVQYINVEENRPRRGETLKPKVHGVARDWARESRNKHKQMARTIINMRDDKRDFARGHPDGPVLRRM